MPVYVQDPLNPSGTKIDVMELKRKNPGGELEPVLIKDYLKHDLWSMYEAVLILAGYDLKTECNLTADKQFNQLSIAKVIYLDKTAAHWLSDAGLTDSLSFQCLNAYLNLIPHTRYFDIFQEKRTPNAWIEWAIAKDLEPYWLDYAKNLIKPESVADAGAGSQAATEQASTKIAPIFSEFKNLRANEISLVMMQNETAKIVIRGASINVNPDELGLKAGSQDWKLLEGAAVNQGELANPLKKLNSSSNLEAEKGKIKTAVSRLRTSLKGAIGLKDNPIKYMKDNGYKFTFKTMTHELLNGGNVSKGSDAMDYLDNESFNDNQQGSNGFWRDDEEATD